MVPWMLYSLLVAVLVAAAAVPLERALRTLGRPGRWAWLGAMGASLAIPAVALLVPESPGSTAALGPIQPVAAPVGAVMDMAAGSGADLLRSLEGPLTRLWAGSASILVALLGASLLHLRRSLAGWRPSVVDGVPVLLSDDVGPAVVGVFHHRIVLPRWVVEGGRDARRLILRHEAEHVAARDPLLVLVAALPAILMPWNLALWWQLRRLRAAVELDCDARVLRSATPGVRHRYGQLLLDVGRRSSRRLPALARFSEGRSALGRRIRYLATRMPRRPGRTAAALGLGAAALLVFACSVPEPTAPLIPEEPEALEVPAIEVTAPAIAGDSDVSPRPPAESAARRDAPTFTPYSVAPDILNRAEVAQALEESYPPLLRDAGVTGTVRVYFHIDEEGRVTDTRVQQSSGRPELDEAALRVAAVMRFSPALNRDQPVPVWVNLPIRFDAGSRRSAQAGRGDEGARIPPPPPPAAAPGGEVPPGSSAGGRVDSSRPSFTPYTLAPDITNRAEVARALETNYPPLLRDAGIGGTARVYLFIDDAGAVQDVRVDQSSGSGPLDEAALRVASVMRFTPAENRGRPVPVWISLPIRFETR